MLLHFLWLQWEHPSQNIELLPTPLVPLAHDYFQSLSEFRLRPDIKILVYFVHVQMKTFSLQSELPPTQLLKGLPGKPVHNFYE